MNNNTDTTVSDSFCESGYGMNEATNSHSGERQSTVVDLSTKSTINTGSTNYQYDQLAEMLKLPFTLSSHPPSLLSPPTFSNNSCTRPVSTMSKPLAYCTPNPVPNLPENNQVHLLEYRGAQLAAFKVDGRDLVCLPQAFELFLKHLVGGLHTVYTKLKRLEIVPVVCNVEQVRILRGLGAIQPGVNRCKLIAPHEFDVLYADCTNSSARPGRPSKRISTATSTSVTRNVDPSCDSSQCDQFGYSPVEPSVKIPRKLFADPTTMNRNNSMSRTSGSLSVSHLPYTSSLASFCLDPDAIGRILSDTEPFIQAMNHMGTSLLHPGLNSSLNFNAYRVPFLPTDRNEHTTTDQRNNGTTVPHQAHRIQTAGCSELGDARPRLYSTPVSVNNGSSPIGSPNKAPIKHTIRRITGLELDQSTPRKMSVSVSAEHSTDTGEPVRSNPGQREVSANHCDWFKLNPFVIPPKPFPAVNNDLFPPLFSVDTFTVPQSCSSSYVTSEPWNLHSERLANNDPGLADLMSRWKMPLPIPLPQPSLDSSIARASNSTDLTGATNSVRVHAVQDNGLAEFGSAGKKHGQASFNSTKWDSAKDACEQQGQPTIMNSESAEKNKGFGGPSDEFRACFDSMFYEILEVYHQMLQSSKTSGSTTSLECGLENNGYDIPSLNSVYPDSLNELTTSLFTHSSTTSICNKSPKPEENGAHREHASSPHRHRFNTNGKAEKRLNSEQLTASESTTSNSLIDNMSRKSEGTSGRKFHSAPADSSNWHIPSTNSPQIPPQLPPSSDLMETSLQLKETCRSAERGLTIRHHQWLHFMARTFLFNYLNQRGNSTDSERRTSDELQRTQVEYNK
ncbi:Dachshund protein 1 [Fasciola hepatica]|uniref:Dachshund protein 1 n=1 Tax=Fasciola hepatica TaxID=6192 RepID=A0A4E0RUX5_FASHE|nr:Dachshund protein 1 [Fasciola hepatica]